MIRYALRCDAGHGFEAWFRGSDDFEAQRARGLVTCPQCGSGSVEKALMTPAVARTRKGDARPPMPDVARAPAPSAGSGDAAGHGPAAKLAPAQGPQAEVIAKLRALKSELMKSADDVGAAFPEEARKIHYGEAEERGIYGAASVAEVAELHEEGIAVMPLPVLPEDKN